MTYSCNTCDMTAWLNGSLTCVLNVNPGDDAMKCTDNAAGTQFAMLSGNLAAIGMYWQEAEADRLAYAVCQAKTKAECENTLKTLVPKYILPVVDAEARKSANRSIGVSREAVTHVFEQLVNGKYNPFKGHFESWCRRVVQNYHVDICRQDVKHEKLHEKMIDERRFQPLDLQGDEKSPANEQSDRLCDSVKQITSAAGWEPRGKINYLPVFLLELRRVLAMKLLQTRKDDFRLSVNIDITPGFIMDAVCRMVPWTPAQDRMIVREECPALAAIWRCVEARLTAGNVPAADLVIKSIVAAGGTQLSRDTWYQWSHRAVELAQQLAPDANWELFGHWFSTGRRHRPAGRVVAVAV